jgi:hypothetical protein
MKRYRVLAYDFDTRANILNTDIKDDWKPQVKAQWENNKNQIKEGLIAAKDIRVMTLMSSWR